MIPNSRPLNVLKNANESNSSNPISEGNLWQLKAGR